MAQPAAGYQVQKDLVNAASLMKRQRSHGESHFASQFNNNYNGNSDSKALFNASQAPSAYGALPKPQYVKK